MERCAVFVDAGYLFAQGSVVLCGQKQRRSSISIDAVQVVSLLKTLAVDVSGVKLLRVYWYDGAEAGVRPTADQATLAMLDDVKLRLGFINSHGQQKGVDSLIVTDMIELARLKSISDALLLSGDEDVRIGVQIAQSHGVRVHLLGITPSRASQSLQLMQEADTMREWGKDEVSSFLSLREAEAPLVDLPSVVVAAESRGMVASEGEGALAAIQAAVDEFVRSLGAADINGIQHFWQGGERGIPREFDSRLLTLCRERLGRSLVRSEMSDMRKAFKSAVVKYPN